MAVAAVLAVGALAPARTAMAEEKVEFKAGSTMREMLAQFTGKRVALRIDEGAELDGTLVMVGDQVAQLTKVIGREYSDAYVRLDSIKAFVIKVR
jgi:hypothetical protein